ncbi:unnamed protein product [Choristocarpus tenellus]
MPLSRSVALTGVSIAAIGAATIIYSRRFSNSVDRKNSKYTNDAGAGVGERSLVGEASVELQKGCEGCDCNDDQPGPLEGTMKPYERHVIICSGTTEWLPQIESEDSSLASALHGLCRTAGLITLKQKKTKKAKDTREAGTDDTIIGTTASKNQSEGDGAMEVKSATTAVSHPGDRVRITACDEPSRGPPGTTDVIVYPEGLIYTLGGTSPMSNTLEEFVKVQLVEGKVNKAMEPRPVPFSKMVLVCVHGSRDKRCGRAGPQVLEAMSLELQRRSVTGDEVTLRGCSHIGGHRFAAVCIVYPEGDWYGQVTKKNAVELIGRCVTGGKVLKANWRGNMSPVI